MTPSVIGALRVVLGANIAEFEAGLTRAQARMQAFGGKMAVAGAAIGAGLTAPIQAFVGTTLVAAGKFEASMNRVQAVSGATSEEFEALRKQARDLGATTQFTASQSAEAMGFLAMAGFRANQILGAMPGTLQLAASAQISFAKAADIVTNVLTGYGMEVEELGHANDVLVKAFTSANTNLEQLGVAFKYAAGIGKTAGLQFEEVTAALAMMGNAGIQASMAGTSLRGAIMRMVDPTREIQQAMQEAGLTFMDVNGQLLPLVDIIKQLEPHLNNPELLSRIFGARAMQGMAALVRQGSGALAEFTRELMDSGGIAQHIAEVQMRGLNGAILKLKSAFEALQLSVADSGLLDWATRFTTKVADFIRGLSEADPAVLRFALALSQWIAVLGPSLIVIGLLIPAIVAISAPVWAAAAAIGAIVAVLAAFWPEIKYGAALITNFVAIIAEKLGGVIKNTFDPLGQSVLEAMTMVWTTMKRAASVVAETAAEIYRSVKDWLKDKLGVVWDAVVTGLEKVRTGFRNFLQWIANSSFVKGAKELAAGVAKGVVHELTAPIRQLQDLGTDISEIWAEAGARAAAIAPAVGEQIAAPATWGATLVKRATADMARTTAAAATQISEGMKEAEALRFQAQNEAMLEGKRLMEEARTPAQEYAAQLANIRDLQGQGALTANQAGLAFQQAAERAGASWSAAGPAIAGNFAEIANAFGRESSRMAKTGQILGAVQALISTWVGQAKALELPWPANFAAFTAIAAKGLGLVAAIRSATVPGFATGGSFRVGGAGGRDSQLVPLRLTPGEMVDIKTPEQQESGGRKVLELRGIGDGFMSWLDWRRFIEELNRQLGDNVGRIELAKR